MTDKTDPLITAQNCPCGRDYDFHVKLLWEYLQVNKSGTADVFLTLDPWLLQHRELFEGIIDYKCKIQKPTEFVKEFNDVARTNSIN